MKRAYSNRDLIRTLDPEQDYLRIYQLTTLYDFPTDMRVGLNLAFYRIFAIPHLAELLVRSGEIVGRPTKRAYDTGLIMYEIFVHGFDHPRAREMIRLLNRVHKPWPISNDDYLYVLAALMVVPLQWLDRRGWRPLLPQERQASVAFYRTLAPLMAIHEPPAGYAEAATLIENYEAEHLGYSDAGRKLMDATEKIIVHKLPKPLKPVGPAITSALFDQPRLTDALGLPTPNPLLTRLVGAGFSVRNIMTRLRPARDQSWFVPGRPASLVYPKGYVLRQLGPKGFESAAPHEPASSE